MPSNTLPVHKDDSPDGEPKIPVRQSMSPRLSTHLKTNITLHHADIPIIICCFISGLCDSSAFNAWNTFVSMQTGNTIFLALGASGQPPGEPYGWLKSLTSIFFFLCGCFFFAQSRRIGAQSRGALSLSFFIQSAFIIVAAALVQGKVVHQPNGTVVEDSGVMHFKELIPIGFLSFQSGGQVVTSRILGFNEVPTTVLTSVYCDLMMDPGIIAPFRDNLKRNRRVAAAISLLIGGICGGFLSKSKAHMSTTLWIAAGIKMAISLSWFLWKPKKVIQA
ncbi:hypothetical protein F5884DRAFT_854954 [Xylogone sp. PMI_703]|nr:hypothetical protein F5884DRAFT_854954 [Xylogone sp. PMI_703]